jgi:uncharacterized membrane protein YjjP (DUF1212 family)
MPDNWVETVRRWLASLRKERPQRLIRDDVDDESLVAAMLRELGLALLEVEQPTHEIETRLTQIAALHTDEPVRVVAQPNALWIQVGTEGYELAKSSRLLTHLDMAGRVEHIANLAAVGAITPADALGALATARKLPPRFGSLMTVLGYALTTVGFGMSVNPTWTGVSGYAFLGLVVGVIVVITRQFPALEPIVPTVSAMVVTILATLFVADAANEGMLRIISPALVTMLPGVPMTIGAMELARTEVVAGSSRLIYGAVQLALLVFGVSLGLAIAGRPAQQSPSAQMGAWSFYVAILVISIGLYIVLSAPRQSLLWLTASIAVALLGQKIGGYFFSEAHSGAIGAFLVVPFATLASRIRSSPPAMVMKVASFWALVPGALSFVSLSQAVAGTGDFEALKTTVGAIFSIALGTLVGASVFEAFDTLWRRRSEHLEGA